MLRCYFYNNPISFKDPTGLAPEEEKGDEMQGKKKGDELLNQSIFQIMRGIDIEITSNIKEIGVALPSNLALMVVKTLIVNGKLCQGNFDYSTGNFIGYDEGFADYRKDWYGYWSNNSFKQDELWTISDVLSHELGHCYLRSNCLPFGEHNAIIIQNQIRVNLMRRSGLNPEFYDFPYKYPNSYQNK